MTNEEILKKIIDKSAKGGWQYASYWYGEFEKLNWELKPYQIRGVFLSHNFAKAFWGIGSRDDKDYMDLVWPQNLWEYHLQQMVLEEDPIKYLELSLSES